MRYVKHKKYEELKTELQQFIDHYCKFGKLGYPEKYVALISQIAKHPLHNADKLVVRYDNGKSESFIDRLIRKSSDHLPNITYDVFRYLSQLYLPKKPTFKDLVTALKIQLKFYYEYDHACKRTISSLYKSIVSHDDYDRSLLKHSSSDLEVYVRFMRYDADTVNERLHNDLKEILEQTPPTKKSRKRYRLSASLPLIESSLTANQTSLPASISSSDLYKRYRKSQTESNEQSFGFNKTFK